MGTTMASPLTLGRRELPSGSELPIVILPLGHQIHSRNTTKL